MLMAVEESASGLGKGRIAGSRGTQAPAFTRMARFGLPATTLAAWCAMGLPWAASAQVVADPNAGANRPAVVQTANGLQQVNITRPSTAGVSVNAYTQFDVPKAGIILNNSPSIVATQQAGYVNGNPNLLPGGSARIIVNQATGTLPSQLRGYLEVAGQELRHHPRAGTRAGLEFRHAEAGTAPRRHRRTALRRPQLVGHPEIGFPRTQATC
ncbi:adhesin [Cupriavidus sp. GA3-3]|nr:adhesin [Cupriavidus sp. GA3-3]